MEDVKWFPLDRISELESAIAALIANPATTLQGIVCCLGLHGMRVSEITRALVKHFSPLNRTLYVCPWDPTTRTCKPLKKGNARTITMDQSVVDAIVDYRSTVKHTQSKFLLPSRSGGFHKSQRLSSAGRKLLVSLGMMDDPSTRFHMFRHTYAMRLLAETNDITLVRKYLGHRNIQTTMVYLDCIKQVPESCHVKLANVKNDALENA